MIDLLLVNDGLTAINVVISLWILVTAITIVVVGRPQGAAHRSVARAVLMIFSVLCFWTVFGRWAQALDGPATEFVLAFVAVSLRIALAIIMTAWAWDSLEHRKELLEERRDGV